jgi:hypothetical protein
MSNPSPETVLVAGNGQSLERIVPGRVLATDFMLRVNNFFFERRRFLGDRVDLAFVAGDPRIAPFVFEAMAQARDQYRIGSWAALTPRIAQAGARLGRHGVAQTPFRLRDAMTEAALTRLQADHGAVPTAGVRAILLAHALGARKILLAGLDLYKGDMRYAYDPGPHQLALLGADLGRRSYDTALHSAELDRRVIGWLAEQPDLTLWRTADVPALNDLLDLAPPRTGQAVEVMDKRPITDWPHRAGFQSIHMLRILRRVRWMQRRLFGRGVP